MADALRPFFGPAAAPREQELLGLVQMSGRDATKRSIVSSKHRVTHTQRTKVKTGCATCRIRKVKCDEHKPSCQKCVSTGRKCDGYASPFKFQVFTHRRSARDTRPGQNVIKLNAEAQSAARSTPPNISQDDIDLVNRYFSIKTLLDVPIDCDEEARQVLQASLTDPPVRHALDSLKALRTDLEASGDGATAVVQQNSSYGFGMEQYNMALGGLASNLSSQASGDISRLNSALMCCQIFISIEQVLGNYAAMGQHIIRGLGIMHEYRTRLNPTSQKEEDDSDQISSLDVFIIKVFAAPCKFVDLPATPEKPNNSSSENTVSASCPFSVTAHRKEESLEPSDHHRAIAPDMRAELIRISASTLGFLGRLSKVGYSEEARRLQSEKETLLESLKSWLARLNAPSGKRSSSNASPGPEPDSDESIPVYFLRMFHQILKIVVLGALDSSLETYKQLQIESDRLQSIANSIGEKVKGYKIPST